MKKVLFFGFGILLGIGCTNLYLFALTLDPMTLFLQYFIYVEPMLEKLGATMGEALEAVTSM